MSIEVSDLRECPLCNDYAAVWPDNEPESAGYEVGCSTCGCNVHGDTEAEAIAAWNHRSPSPRIETRASEDDGVSYAGKVHAAEAPMANAIDDVKLGRPVGEKDLETVAWNCDMWPDWLTEKIEEAMEVSDRLDMSTEQVLAYAILASPAPSQHTGWSDEAVEAAKSPTGVHFWVRFPKPEGEADWPVDWMTMWWDGEFFQGTNGDGYLPESLVIGTTVSAPGFGNAPPALETGWRSDEQFGSVIYSDGKPLDEFDLSPVLAEAVVDRAYKAAEEALRGTSADIGVGELDRIIRAALAASSIAPATGFEVKALAWVDDGEATSASALGLHYNLFLRDGVWKGYADGWANWFLEPTASVTEAKAAAQAHFDAAIRSSISPSVAKESGEP